MFGKENFNGGEQLQPHAAFKRPQMADGRRS
jgi:hypothetical protein